MLKHTFRDLITLKPSEFRRVGQHWIDLSTVTNPTIHVFNDLQTYKTIQLPYAKGSAKREPWPSNSKGFFYYSTPPHRPRISGELRLRLTPTSDPSTFPQGTDLCLSKHLNQNDNDAPATVTPWRRPLYSIATSSTLRPLYDKLRAEGLVSPTLASALRALPRLTIMYSRCQLVHALQDTFALDLSSDWITLVAMSEHGLASVHLLRHFRDMRAHVCPYTGVVLARFEPSSMPEHRGTRTVVLRILREITPVRCVLPGYDEYIRKPTPGELYEKCFHGKMKPWSVDIDQPARKKLATEGLKLIWDATSMYRGVPIGY